MSAGWRRGRFLTAGLLAVSLGCGKTDPPEAGPRGVASSAVRAARRAYDGAPPVIPHLPFGAACVSCHGPAGLQVPGVGFAPPSPHGEASGFMAGGRCEQCHVFRQAETLFAGNGFEGLRQDLRRGSRLHEFAPPVIPHQLLLRENCAACHSGPLAREEIRCDHPERLRCQQCHAGVATAGLFSR